MSNSSVSNILDFPDEILVKIILYFDPRERLALANSCQRFNDLVFSDKELLRNLDFTEEERHEYGEEVEQQLTEESDIQQYFNNENTYKKIRGLNVENSLAASCLKSSVSKAINLVELKILNGIYLGSIEELASFLEPMVHLKRLSVEWPYSFPQDKYDNPDWNQVLEKPFGRLTHFSLRITFWTKEILLVLQLCQQLEELHMLIDEHIWSYYQPLRQEPMKLSNLKIFRSTLSAWAHNQEVLRDDLMSIVLDPAEWTDFYHVQDYNDVYLERNVEVCAELKQLKKFRLPRSIREEGGLIDESWHLVSQNLLTEVIRVTHDDAPDEFCCLSWSNNYYSFPCLLEIDEAKKLLKDPGHQISCLRFLHVIEKNCDIHLLASAFPNLTSLSLSGISNGNSMSEPQKTFHRRLRKKGSPTFEEPSDPSNTNSSFKMLVENTPHLQVLKMRGVACPQSQNEEEYWDLDALYLILGWKNLTVILLDEIPIKDAKFLINIGRECKKLERVTLHRLSFDKNSNWQKELLQMLRHCKNLRIFSLHQWNLKPMARMFKTLSKCSRLEDLDLKTACEEYDSLAPVLSIQKMLRQCQQLNTLSINTPQSGHGNNSVQLAVESIISKLNRPDFMFNGRWL